MIRLDQIPHFDDFFKALKLTLTNFAISHNVTRDSYFANILSFKGENANINFNKLITPSNPNKNLTVRELLHLLDNTPEHNKEVLDYLCKRYGFVCSTSAQSKKEDDIQNIFMDIADLTGDISKVVKEAKKDGKIDNSEKKIIDSYLYKLRSKIKGYENG
jgi:hypothetical protein